MWKLSECGNDSTCADGLLENEITIRDYYCVYKLIISLWGD